MKHFHKETIAEIEKDRIDFRSNRRRCRARAFVRRNHEKIYSNVTYLVLPEREKMAQTFIKTAIEISNDYELDIED